jgi:hypothetical protein
MAFPLPDIKTRCPICTKMGCARWKGYYSRGAFCPVQGLFERVAIHVGRCPAHRKDFSFLPELFIPYRQITKPSLSKFFEYWRRTQVLQKALDRLPQADDRWIVSVSTAWEWTQLILKFCRLNLEMLPVPNSIDFRLVSDLLFFNSPDEICISNPKAQWPGAINQILHPP